jgi:hypothetical protein
MSTARNPKPYSMVLDPTSRTLRPAETLSPTVTASYIPGPAKYGNPIPAGTGRPRMANIDGKLTEVSDPPAEKPAAERTSTTYVSAFAIDGEVSTDTVTDKPEHTGFMKKAAAFIGKTAARIHETIQGEGRCAKAAVVVGAVALGLAMKDSIDAGIGHDVAANLTETTIEFTGALFSGFTAMVLHAAGRERPASEPIESRPILDLFPTAQ